MRLLRVGKLREIWSRVVFAHNKMFIFDAAAKAKWAHDVGIVMGFRSVCRGAISGRPLFQAKMHLLKGRQISKEVSIRIF